MAELLLGSSHYTKAIDIWATGCIMAELVACRPLFYCQDSEDSRSLLRSILIYTERETRGVYHFEQIKTILQFLGLPKDSGNSEFHLLLLPAFHFAQLGEILPACHCTSSCWPSPSTALYRECMQVWIFTSYFWAGRTRNTSTWTSLW